MVLVDEGDRVSDELTARRGEIEERLRRLRVRQGDLAHRGPDAVSPASARAAAEEAVESLARANRAHDRVSAEHLRAADLHLRAAERLEALGRHEDADEESAAAARELEAASREQQRRDEA